ncbi:MAG: hypothetical protein IPK10_18770 [Bacteroidetes bacterium]|nr:hypothetical protein [Bacteroidota bacterium]
MTVPIVFHVIHQNGPENIPDSIIVNELVQLNNRFSNSAPFNYGNNVNVQIQFCLASVDPFGNPTTGITRDTSFWAVLPAGWGANADATMKNINRWNPSRYLNVWLPKQTVAGIGTNAYSSYPWSIGSPLDGIVIESLSLGFTHFLLAHEVGHYLGLYHLNEGDSCINYNCLLDGDHVCDTPPVYQPIDCAASSCSTDMDDTSGFNPFTMDTIDISNIMMPILPCDYVFTQGQADRMNYFLTTTRQDLLSSVACGQTPPIMALPTAGMSVTASACTGYVFTFTGSGAEYVEWDFNNDGAFDGMGNSVNHVYGGTGYYTVVQRVFNGAGYDTDTLTLFAQSTTNTLFPLTSVTNNNPSNNGGNLCRGAKLTLTAIPNMAQYIWSTGDSTQSISFTVDSAVSVSVTCIDSSGIIWEKCPSPFFTWNVIPSPPYVNLQVLTNDTLCQGDTFKVYVPVPAGNFIGQDLSNGFIQFNQDTLTLNYVIQQHQYLSVILRNANYCRTWLDTAYVHFQSAHSWSHHSRCKWIFIIHYRYCISPPMV